MSKFVRPPSLSGFTRKVFTGCGNLYITINGTPPIEVFAVLGKEGGCQGAQLEAIARLVSLNLRSGVEVKDVIKQLKDISCPSPILFPSEDRIKSCPDAMAKVLSEL